MAMALVDLVLLESFTTAQDNPNALRVHQLKTVEFAPLEFISDGY